MAEDKLVPVHPGEVLLEEFLKPMGLSQNRLAIDIGVRTRRINEIVFGKRCITAGTALRLARYFDMPAEFHVIFQCKRYRGSVTVSQVRDFRGAMIGWADKGLLVTTGKFTKEAMREATRDGAPAIDLIDGDLLIYKLKELELGVKTERVETEKVTVDRDWILSM